MINGNISTLFDEIISLQNEDNIIKYNISELIDKDSVLEISIDLLEDNI